MEDTPKERWQEAYDTAKLRDDVDFDTLSSTPLDPLYSPEDIDPRVGVPGEYPYTRGIYSSGYRGRLWTMRQFSGFGSPKQTNERYKYLLEHGQTGLSVAFDMPTLMGRDSDDPVSEGEVGRCGVAVDSLLDMEILFEGIDIAAITTSMTISGPAPMLFAFYVAAAEKQGADVAKLDGTCQTDILKEYIAQKEWLFPPAPHLRLTADMMEYCISEVPKYHPLSISGYHIREAGSTAVQELAFTLSNAIAYVEAAIDAGLEVDEFAPRLSFFFNAHNDLFQEVAKYRAARRMWASIMRDRFGATDERSRKLRFHTQTAGSSLTAQQAENNIVRTTVQALSAVLGGTQSLHTNAFDEALALPTERSARIALRTQQILASEGGLTGTADPLAGSYYVESLTDAVEEAAWAYIKRIDEMGGSVKAVEERFMQREIEDAAYRYQREVEREERVIVGVNRYTSGGTEDPDMELHTVDETIRERQKERLADLKDSRDNAAVEKALARLKRAAEDSDNLLYPMKEALAELATLGEVSDTLRGVFGEYRPS